MNLDPAPKVPHGVLGRAVYRAVVPVDDLAALAERLERAVRADYEPAGFEVRTGQTFGSWFLSAHRGTVSGFEIGLVPGAGPDGAALVGVARSSRADRAAGWAAVGAAAGAALCALAAGAVGLPVPGLVLGGVAVAVAALVLLGGYQLLIPVVAGIEFLAGGRLSAEQMEAVVALVRGVVEAPGPAANPPGAPGGL